MIRRPNTKPWKVKIDSGKPPAPEKAKAVAKIAGATLGVTAAYFGVIAVLMSPAFDVVWKA